MAHYDGEEWPHQFRPLAPVPKPFHEWKAEEYAKDQAVRAALMSQDLYQVLLDVQNGIDSPGLKSMANGAIRKLDKARAELYATEVSPPSSIEATEPTDELLGRMVNVWYEYPPDHEPIPQRDDATTDFIVRMRAVYEEAMKSLPSAKT